MSLINIILNLTQENYMAIKDAHYIIQVRTSIVDICWNMHRAKIESDIVIEEFKVLH